jgi:hypothetical protein
MNPGDVLSFISPAPLPLKHQYRIIRNGVASPWIDLVGNSIRLTESGYIEARVVYGEEEVREEIPWE